MNAKYSPLLVLLFACETPAIDACLDTDPTRCQGNAVASCVDGSIVTEDCSAQGLLCEASSEGAACVSPCGNGALDPGEACDDGNAVNGDGCNACELPFCGNDIIDSGEQCDDGNTSSGDSCDASCLAEGLRRTALASNIDIPDDAAENVAYGRDYSGDGVVDAQDNSLLELASVLSSFGLDMEFEFNASLLDGNALIGLDTIALDFANGPATLLGYKAVVTNAIAPSFDGTDVIAAVGDLSPFEASIIDNNFSSEESNFFFTLSLGNGLESTLPLHRSQLQGTLVGSGIDSAVLSGVVDAVEFAERLEDYAVFVGNIVEIAAVNFGFGVPIACINDTVCNPFGIQGICTDRTGVSGNGLCIATDSNAAVVLGVLDDNDNGTIEVSYDSEALLFNDNELSLLFDMRGNGDPAGLAGNLFRLDQNGDGKRDAMGVGLGFAAVSATRQ